jgi:hypothetical protein
VTPTRWRTPPARRRGPTAGTGWPRRQPAASSSPSCGRQRAGGGLMRRGLLIGSARRSTRSEFVQPGRLAVDERDGRNLVELEASGPAAASRRHYVGCDRPCPPGLAPATSWSTSRADTVPSTCAASSSGMSRSRVDGMFVKPAGILGPPRERSVAGDRHAEENRQPSGSERVNRIGMT